MWRGGLGRCLCSLLARSFGCGCHIISTMLRFHTPLIKPGGRISRTRLSDKACVIAIFPLRRQRRLVHGGAGRVSGVSQPVSGVHRLAPISRLSSPSALGLELRPLPSTRVTRRPRYYEPLRHPGGNPACGVGPGGVSEKSLPMRAAFEKPRPLGLEDAAHGCRNRRFRSPARQGHGTPKRGYSPRNRVRQLPQWGHRGRAAS